MSRAVSSVASDQALGVLIEDLTARLQAGVSLEVDALLRAHPEYTEELQRLLPALQILAEVARSGVAGVASVPSADGDADPLRGTLGDFRILREVGKGGMGVVYEAEQISLGRRVALKVLPFAAALDLRQLQRFKTEAQAAACLHHAHIVPVYAVGCERGVHFYAMQFIDGQPLAALLAELRQQAGMDPVREVGTVDRFSARVEQLLSGNQAPACPNAETAQRAGGTVATGPVVTQAAYFRTVAALGMQAAEALEHAHGMGVLHRDIKPGNLLLDGRGTLWVTDFGLAQVQSDPRLTLTGDLVGTLRYMSPEQALAKRTILDQRTDVYSLGVTLYELLTLEPAFPGRDRQELLRQIAFEEPRPLRSLNRAVPADLETVVIKAMAKDSAERYASAQELADDLGRFLENRPIRARRPKLVHRASKWAGRHQPLVLTAVAALFLVTVTLGVSTWLIARSRAEAVARERDLGQQLYPADISAAHRAMQAGNGEQARALLARHIPQEGEEDLRGFEWYYLWGSCQTTKPLTLQGHAGRVYGVTFSPDGSILASAGQDRTVRLWHVATGQELALFRGHTEEVNRLKFSADGKTLASVSDDGTVRLWDVASRRLTAVLARPDGRVIGVSFLAQGRMRARVVTRGGEGIEFWDPETDGRQELPNWRSDAPPRSGAVSCDGRILALGDVRGNTNFWSVDTGAHLGSLPPPRFPFDVAVESVAFSRDGRVATATMDYQVRLWQVGAQLEDFVFSGHEAACRAVAFSPDGSLLASGSDDQTTRVWDVTSRMPREVLRARAAIWCVSFSPCGRMLACGGADGFLELHQLLASPSPGRLRARFGALSAVRIAPDGESLAAVAECPDQGRVVRLWAQTTGSQWAEEPHGPPIPYDGTFGYSRDGRTLAATTHAGIALCEPSTGRLLGHYDGARHPALTADGRTFAATNSSRQDISLWDVSTGALRERFRGQHVNISALAFSLDGQTLISGHADGQVLLWDATTGQNHHATPARHRARVEYLALSPDGLTLATASPADSAIHLWDLPNRRPLPSIAGRFTGVVDLAFSPDGKTLAVVSCSRVQLFHTATAHELFAVEYHSICQPRVSFSPDGQMLTTGMAPVHGKKDVYELITWHAPRPALSPQKEPP